LRHVDQRFHALLRGDDDFFDRLILGRAHVRGSDQQDQGAGRGSAK
jgi:hypothetical protein